MKIDEMEIENNPFSIQNQFSNLIVTLIPVKLIADFFRKSNIFLAVGI